jgi:two-component system chemotaxis sensor kinase CheA
MLRLAELLGEAAAPEERDPIQVVVYHHDGRDLGLVVENILDIVEENLTIHRRVGGGSVSGTAVIQGKVTDLLDVRAVIDGADVLHFAATSADEPQLAGV